MRPSPQMARLPRDRVSVAAPAASLALLAFKSGQDHRRLAGHAAFWSTAWPMYTTLLMSTGLTIGTISALLGLSHQLIDTAQYSALAAVIESAVVPTVMANAFFCPAPSLPA